MRLHIFTTHFLTLSIQTENIWLPHLLPDQVGDVRDWSFGGVSVGRTDSVGRCAVNLGGEQTRTHQYSKRKMIKITKSFVCAIEDNILTQTHHQYVVTNHFFSTHYSEYAPYL